jgi:phage regulatory protein, rha family
MNELQVFNFNEVDVVDSRAVAEMVGKNHRDLMRSIHGYIDVMGKSTERNFAPSDFFIPRTYKDSTGRTLPCYLLTKKGCDMVANKMTGEKGVLFTAAYVTAFEKMREKLSSPAVPRDYLSALRALVSAEEQRVALLAENEQQRQIIEDFEPIKQYVDTILESKGTLATSQIAADYAMSAKALNRILHEEKIQHYVNGQWILYKKHMGKGYTKSHTFHFNHSDGRPDTRINTQWTQKGRLMIHEILTQRGIRAVMDREMAV